MSSSKALRKEFYEHVRIPGEKEGLNVELDKAIHLRDFITMGRADGVTMPLTVTRVVAGTSVKSRKPRKARPNVMTSTSSMSAAGSIRVMTPRLRS